MTRLRTVTALALAAPAGATAALPGAAALAVAGFGATRMTATMGRLGAPVTGAGLARGLARPAAGATLAA
ncbi:hypothetical protein CKO24_09615, partial [Rhodothalassium salexigens DSM 2132]|nr:hypothetical protein [Rhodothalassium salexigens DSM 2132]